MRKTVTLDTGCGLFQKTSADYGNKKEVARTDNLLNFKIV